MDKRWLLLGVVVVLIMTVIYWVHSLSDWRPEKITGIVVPHHDLVKAQREQFFAEVAQKISAPKTIILVSPNHFNEGKGLMQTTGQQWQVTEGMLQPNTEVIQALVEGGVSEEPNSFQNEHGIKLILGDLKHYWPQAQLVPVILKMNTPSNQVEELAQTLQRICTDCLMVSSVDFSHYQPALLASLHDTTTLRALQNLDRHLMRSKAEVDSPPALELLMLWAQAHHSPQFVLRNHTNSGELLHDPTIETTTHFLGWYQPGPQTLPQPAVNFFAGGDMMFGRAIAHAFSSKGLSTSVDQLGDRLFWGADVSLINLEGPVSEVPVADTPVTSTLLFNFSPQTIEVLRFLHVNVASLANNHSGDNGAAGLATTRRLLNQASIAPLGGPSSGDATQLVTIEGEKLKLAIIGVHALIPVPNLRPLIQSLKQDPLTRVLVFPHWGTEYAPLHSVRQQTLAHEWIDAGADIVIGSHPHVIQDSEVYKNKPIIYSLGNLLFDQNFSPATQEGLLVGGSFTAQGLTLFGLPTQSSHYKPMLAGRALRQQLLEKLYRPLAAFKQTTAGGDVYFFPN